MPTRMALATLCLLVAAPAGAGRLDERLAAQEPCRELPPISETEAVTLERATISFFPETAELSLAGRISCHSAKGAILESDASVRLEADVEVELAGCTTTSADVRLSEFEGSLRDLVQALTEPLQTALIRNISRAAEDACLDLFDGD